MIHGGYGGSGHYHCCYVIRLFRVLSTIYTAVHGLHADHSGLARRMSGDVNLQKRGAGSRWSFYNTETGNA